ncbi:DUF5681 domain-containing protein [Azospirillum doebereinerae]|uniref:DUF5681 domain-containing protein n=1 Tax=Azospirillum doebereinerae TaxID=92933 RepID=A0A3S0VJP5_9PROT|nr:DUF5681 domain-containing protein [Azospirillum doebereinerae]RUQ74019.1 hypothetical protein EJ913_06510 [Azospirillum doebereinerae]
MSDKYDVGYGKPPRHSRFKKGRSGNPAGRPKGRRRIEQTLLKLAMQVCTIRRNGEIEQANVLEALFHVIVVQASKGNAGIAIKLTELLLKVEERAESRAATTVFAQPTGVLVVPGMMEIDDWEKAAEKQQAQYRSAVGDPPGEEAELELADPGEYR